MTRIFGTTALATLFAAALGATAMAQGTGAQGTTNGQGVAVTVTGGEGGTSAATQGTQSGKVVPISQVNPSALYNRQLISARNLMDAHVYDANGHHIGHVQNVYVGENGQIQGVGASVGGFLGLGDTAVVVPWNKIKLTSQGLVLPITKSNVKNYDLNGNNNAYITEGMSQTKIASDNDQVVPSNSVFRLDNLIGDVATFNNGDRYGYVENALFDTSGKLQTVIVEPTTGYGGGYYAYPYYGTRYGWNPYGGSYGVGYDRSDVAHLSKLNDSKLNLVMGNATGIGNARVGSGGNGVIGNNDNNGIFHNNNGLGDNHGLVGNNHGLIGDNHGLVNNGNGVIGNNDNNNGGLLHNNNNGNNGVLGNND